MSHNRGPSRSGWMMLAGIVVALLGWTAVDGQRKQREEIEARQTEKAEACQAARTLTDDDVLAECQNAASLFGQDLSGDPVRLSICLEQHQDKLASCNESGH